MTKLMQWLSVLALLLATWLYLLFGEQVHPEHRIWVVFLPFFLGSMLAVTSLMVIVYRVVTFNNCQEAADQLQKEIEEARKDLISKGFKFM